jgi:hypothetical protein
LSAKLAVGLRWYGKIKRILTKMAEAPAAKDEV